MCTSTVPYLGRKRTAAKTLATLAAEGSLRDHALETQLFGEQIGESLTPNSVPKCDPSFGVTTRTSLLSSH